MLADAALFYNSLHVRNIAVPEVVTARSQLVSCFPAKQVSTEDADDYKRTLRGQLKALVEREKDPLGQTQWVVCYIKPAASDPLSQGPRKVRHYVALHTMSCPTADLSPLSLLKPYSGPPSMQCIVSLPARRPRPGLQMASDCLYQTFQTAKPDACTFVFPWLPALAHTGQCQCLGAGNKVLMTSQ